MIMTPSATTPRAGKSQPGKSESPAAGVLEAEGVGVAPGIATADIRPVGDPVEATLEEPLGAGPGATTAKSPKSVATARNDGPASADLALPGCHAPSAYRSTVASESV